MEKNQKRLDIGAKNRLSLTDRVLTIQALRAVAFTFIFLGHCRLLPNGFASCGVSIFVALSGFLLTTRRKDELSVGIKPQLSYSWNKIAKLYPLHIICMVGTLPFEFSDVIKGMVTLPDAIIKIVLNIVLLQSWYPTLTVSQSLNGVAWYLSTCMFLYFVSDYMEQTKKYQNTIFFLLDSV